ncbi:MFS transporter [Sphingomonas astaxanthinifaciens]|uniref:Bacteriochlorophyll synthase n=1 Tax=Sphingomonas astaxanthinifaciens DSM 22298 TaxID=1123267 RepID=A0ABQ5Z8F9_9SPHN|nr:MFS transporter [Sphingomonas astaxanthinifaciens]GLR47761.1 bacteriochlorophyll synthase [Sphingomonas astaxanthinifaciens DSM 22298]
MNGWGVILRLGTVQAAIGAMVMLATSLLNRVMVVELGLAAAIPAGLVAWHYAVQLSRPLSGHASDRTGRRTPWIVAGMSLLALGSLIAVEAVAALPVGAASQLTTLVLGFTMIGLGVGAAGTALLALLAAAVPPDRRAAAAATTWIMMVAGIAVAAGVAGSLLQPFTFDRLVVVAGGLVAIALDAALAAIVRLERGITVAEPRPAVPFGSALHEVRRDREAVRFTLFVFLSMLAYSMQDLILEPFTGLVFGAAPGQSTQYAGVQHGGILIGMVLAGLGGGRARRRWGLSLQWWTVGGCLGSAIALAGLAGSALAGPPWPIAGNIFLLGLMNGIFAAAAIGAMMELAGTDGSARAGVRMGVWGAAQAFAFGTGGLLGAVITDIARRLLGHDGQAFALTFAGEAGLFLVAALFAVRLPAAARGRPEAGDYQWSASTPSS